ncbi:MAG: cyclodeaminase/cyclohydrolase family protein [Pseudomonadota bacterium]|nr:cyclodeaminase/cyclohydrolase family protein [Pseudomonadota bacterium]
MNKEVSIKDMSVSALMAHIGSERIAPGAGAAGAVALSLAAACAAKAIAITMKHRGLNSGLKTAFDQATCLAELALLDADRDARAFGDYIRAKSSTAAARLVAQSEHVARLIDTLQGLIHEVEEAVDPRMQGDLLAARALLAAARSIQESNETEALQAGDHGPSNDAPS